MGREISIIGCGKCENGKILQMCCGCHVFLFSIFFDLVCIHSAYETTSINGKSYGTGYGGPGILLNVVAAVVGGGLKVEYLLVFLE